MQPSPIQASNTVQFRQVGNNTIIEIDNAAARASISLFGGHVLSFTPKQDNIDRLWMSPLTKTDGSEAIRGGVPVCWPWFSNQFPDAPDYSQDIKLPSHGYARTSMWTLDGINCPTSDITEITLTFSANELPGFPHEATLVYQITVAKELTLSLQTENTGQQHFDITAALHTYFAVENVEHVEVLGITGEYKDKTQGFAKLETPAHYKIHDEVDRVHLTQECAVTIREGRQSTFIEMQGHDSIVVWNPGSVLAAKMGNVPDDGYLGFLCVEAAITSETSISSKNSHTLIQKVS